MTDYQASELELVVPGSFEFDYSYFVGESSVSLDVGQRCGAGDFRASAHVDSGSEQRGSEGTSARGRAETEEVLRVR